jgi:hypothetical protein
MKRTLILFAIGMSLVPLSGCELDPFRAALPGVNQITLKLPGAQKSGQALSTGELSPMYEKTANVTGGVNGAVHGVYGLIRKIVSMPATERGENHRQWGPSEPSGLERLSYRFRVERDAPETNPDHYLFGLDARVKGQVKEGDFKNLIRGEVQVDENGEKIGSITLDFSNHGDLKPDACHKGQAVIDFDTRIEPRTVVVNFLGVGNPCNDEPAKDATYIFSGRRNGMGELHFSVVGDLHDPAEKRPAEEVLEIHSQWDANGQGRADITLSGGEVPLELAERGVKAQSVTGTECWDELFGLVYAETEPVQMREHVAGDCDGSGRCDAVGSEDACLRD